MGLKKELNSKKKSLIPKEARYKKVYNTITQLDGYLDGVDKETRLTTDERWNLEDSISACESLTRRLKKIVRKKEK